MLKSRKILGLAVLPIMFGSLTTTPAHAIAATSADAAPASLTDAILQEYGSGLGIQAETTPDDAILLTTTETKFKGTDSNIEVTDTQGNLQESLPSTFVTPSGLLNAVYTLVDNKNLKVEFFTPLGEKRSTQRCYVDNINAGWAGGCLGGAVVGGPYGCAGGAVAGLIGGFASSAANCGKD